MKRFIEGEDRHQVTLLPECLDDYIGEDNPVRVVDVFVDELDLAALGFDGAAPAMTGRPAYHPPVLLRIYIYGYLNRVQSSRRLEREESVSRYLDELDLADRAPEASKLRRQTVEHTFGTLKAWMGATHFLTKTLPRVSAEMSLHVLACNLKRMMQIFGAKPLMKAMTAQQAVFFCKKSEPNLRDPVPKTVAPSRSG